MLGVDEGGLEKRLACLVRLVLALGEEDGNVELLRHRVGEPRVALEDGWLRRKGKRQSVQQSIFECLVMIINHDTSI